MRRLGATVALLVLAHLFRMPQTAADWSKDADTNAGSEQAGVKCLTVLNPPDGKPYELSEEEREEFHFLLNINCPGLPFGDKMSVKNGNEEFEVEPIWSSWTSHGSCSESSNPCWLCVRAGFASISRQLQTLVGRLIWQSGTRSTTN